MPAGDREVDTERSPRKGYEINKFGTLLKGSNGTVYSNETAPKGSGGERKEKSPEPFKLSTVVVYVPVKKGLKIKKSEVSNRHEP